MLEEGDTHTAVFESSKVNLEIKKKSRKPESRVAVWAMVVTTLILLGLMFWVLHTLGIFRQEETSKPSQTISYLDDQSSGADSVVSADGVPDFVGKDIDAIKNNPDYTNRFEFIVKKIITRNIPTKYRI